MSNGRKAVRVLVVDDSAFMRRAVERMLAESSAIEVIGTASNGKDAVDLACRLKPDVVVLDVNMPTMNGLEALEQIMAICPVPVLMMSTLTQEGANVTVRALELGAIDFVDKTMAGTTMDIYSLGPVLRDKVFGVAGADVRGAEARGVEVEAEPKPIPGLSLPAELELDRLFPVIAIGASTGGPRALSEIFSGFARGLGAAIIVAQHMPPGFTATLAERLDERSDVEVTEACDGDLLEPGKALIAPGGMQTQVMSADSHLVVRVTQGTSRFLHHPSVDLLFESLATAAGRRTIGVILTGMGYDGAEGLAAVKKAGGLTLVESPATAVIDGMPRAARGSADRVVSLPRMASVIADLCAAYRPTNPERA